MTVSYEDGGSQSGTYTVTYDGNGNTSGSVPTDATEYDATNNTATVLGNTGSLAKTGYTFNGWNTKADGTGDGFAAGNTFTISANTTLYAQWTANTYSVTLPAADAYGSYTMDATNPVAYDTTVELTYTPASGYDNYAATWSVNGTEITGNTFTMPDEAVTVTVSVAEKIDYATLPFEWAGGSQSDFNSLVGVTTYGLGSDYGTTHSPYLIKFDGTNDYIQVKTNGQPGKVTIGVKMIGGGNTSTITVQASSDGTNFSDNEELTISGKQNDVLTLETTKAFASTVRYVRLLFTKGSNVGVGPITINTPSTDPEIVADATIDLTAEDTEGEITYTINNPDGVTTLTANSGAEWISNISVAADKVTFNTSVNTGEARTATITLTYGSLTKDVTVNQAKRVITSTYKLATAIVPGRHYIITNGSDKAMGQQNSNNRAAVDITIENESTTIASTAGVQEILIEFEDATGFYTIYDENAENVADCEGYLYAASNSSNHLKTQASVDNNARWTIVFENDGTATIHSQRGSGATYMQYNSSSHLFSCYLTADTMEDVYLYEKVGDTGTQNFTVSINSECTDGTKSYGTFSAPFAFTVPSDVTVSEIAIENGALKVNDYAAGAIVPANTGVMISSATAGDKTFTSAEGGTSLGSDNRLRPVIWGIEAKDMTAAAADANCKFYRLTMHNGTKIGFWWGADNGAAFDYDTPNRAYLAVPENVTARQNFWFDNEATGISSAKVSESTEQVYDLQGRSVAQPTKGLYIMNGKKVIIK